MSDVKIVTDAGVYIPLIMEQIDLHGGINLKGAAIGDGCIGNAIGTCQGGLLSDQISVAFYYGHGMYPQVRLSSRISITSLAVGAWSLMCFCCLQPLYQQILSACGNFSSATSTCLSLLDEMNSYIGHFDIYNIVSGPEHDYHRDIYESTCMLLFLLFACIV